MRLKVMVVPVPTIVVAIPTIRNNPVAFEESSVAINIVSKTRLNSDVVSVECLNFLWELHKLFAWTVRALVSHL